MITSKELRNAWIRFYEERGHINIGAVSLIGDGSTGVMFNVAGMQPLMPYLLGKEHPSGKKRLCNVQGCVDGQLVPGRLLQEGKDPVELRPADQGFRPGRQRNLLHRV